MKTNDPRVQENLDQLCRGLSRTDNAAFIEAFLRSILTPAEIADLAARWALVKELRQEKPQRQIAKEYNLSLCKITRGSKELKKKDPPMLKMISLSN
ncbi:MAG: trp operon repressor [Spirochaetaceae bacterium]|jgi:TrpR family trp operon transcriptional repressor|nr:trp operon repressor [Spirochaetaceae bacterium]